MKSYNELISAGSTLNLAISGKTFYLKDSSAGEVLTVEFVNRGAEASKIENVGKGFKATPAANFDGIKIRASVDSQVQFIVTDGEIELAFNADAVMIGNTVTNPVPVNFTGTVAPVLGDVHVTNTPAQAIPVTLHGSDDATPIPVTLASTVIANTPAQAIPTTQYQAVAVTDGAPVAATDAAGVLIAVSATRRGLRIKNAGANPVAIGGAGVVFATAAVLIQAGETWNENEAPGAAWYCICATGLASTLNLQTIA